MNAVERAAFRSPWVDSVPASWSQVKLGHIARIYAGGTPDKKNDSFWINGTIPWVNSGAVNQGFITHPSEYITEAGYSNSSARFVPKGALVMALAGQGRTKGMVAQMGIDATCNQSMAAIVIEEDDPRYMMYWLTSNYRNIRGIASDDLRDGLNLQHVSNIPCPRPPLKQQSAIASYLDAETARIDGLIDEKQKLLGHIEEMEAALRFELATQGLNPSVSTAASGIKWAGRIPAHWSVKRNMFLFQQRREMGVDGLPILKVSLHTGVSEGEEDDEGTTRVRKQMEDKSAYQIVRQGDVAYNMMRAWQGAIGAVPIDGLVSPAYVVLEPSEQLDARYFEMLARTPQYMKDFERYSYGIASFRWRLYWEGFKEIRTPVPPIEEQRQIVEAFEMRCQRFRDLRAHVERELEALAELRSATITDAVLGRIDVREHMKH